MILLSFFVFSLYTSSTGKRILMFALDYWAITIAKRFALVSGEFVGGKIFLQLFTFAPGLGQPLCGLFRVKPAKQLLTKQAIVQVKRKQLWPHHGDLTVNDVSHTVYLSP